MRLSPPDEGDNSFIIITEAIKVAIDDGGIGATKTGAGWQIAGADVILSTDSLFIDSEGTTRYLFLNWLGEGSGSYTGFSRTVNIEVNNDIIEMDRGSVANIIQRGGTILGTARSAEFETRNGKEKAKKSLNEYKIDALIVIGGDGTMRGAHEFSKRFRVKMVGLPGTIDNDLYGTDFTIGFDTAVNSALEAVDRIRDTAASLERLFFIGLLRNLRK